MDAFYWVALMSSCFGAVLTCRRLAYQRDCARDDADLASDEAAFYRDLANAALAKLNPDEAKGVS